MAHSHKLEGTSGTVQDATTADVHHSSSSLACGEKQPATADPELGVSADATDRDFGTFPTSNVSEHNDSCDRLEFWWMWKAPGTIGYAHECPSALDDARAEKPLFAAREVEELSDFLQSLAEELGNDKLNTANSFTADERAPKPKLQNH